MSENTKKPMPLLEKYQKKVGNLYVPNDFDPKIAELEAKAEAFNPADDLPFKFDPLCVDDYFFPPSGWMDKDAKEHKAIVTFYVQALEQLFGSKGDYMIPEDKPDHFVNYRTAWRTHAEIFGVDVDLGVSWSWLYTGLRLRKLAHLPTFEQLLRSSSTSSTLMEKHADFN